MFGLGAECMSVAQHPIVANWFRGNELSFAFGMNLSVARLGSVFNGLTQPGLAIHHSVGYAAYIGFGVCIMSLVSAFILVIIDRWAEKKDGQSTKVKVDEKF